MTFSKNGTCILPLAYLGSVDYFVLLNNYDSCIIDIHEYFIKQTLRNRCYIYGANGKQSLIIPVQHTGTKQTIKDIKIANNNITWQRLHWRSIEAAYRSSPFFEFYEDILYPFYHKPYTRLLDFNIDILFAVLTSLNIDVAIEYSSTYNNTYSEIDDFRQQASIPAFYYPHYIQVFSNKHGFMPSLSCIDVLFNQGANTKEYFKNVILKTKK